MRRNNSLWNISKLFKKHFLIFGGLLTVFIIVLYITQRSLVIKLCQLDVIARRTVNYHKCTQHEEILNDFHKFMNELDIEDVLIEPSILFCLLAFEEKELLKKRRFKLESFNSSSNIINFGLREDNPVKLNEMLFKCMSKSHNFEYINVYADGSSYKERKYFKTHYFFKRAGVVIHAVVFQQKNDYFWINKIPDFHYPIIPSLDNLQFAYDDAAYEKFNVTYVAIDDEFNSLAIPENPAFFLHQIETSKFIECNMTRAHKLSKKDLVIADDDPIRISFENALTVLKHHLKPRLINFYLSSGTLLGWYRQCNLIPYTHDVDFATFAYNADTADFWINTFAKDPKLPLTLIMGIPEEAFELRFQSLKKYIDLFFAYYEDNLYWVSGHRSDYYRRYTYSPFTLCSGDLLGHKVLVPCDTGKMLLPEYGEHWDEAVKQWQYDKAPKNMVPKKIFWSNETKNQISNLTERLKAFKQ